MDLSKTLYSLIGVMVSILIIATVATPVIMDSTHTEPDRVYNNEGNGYSNDISALQSISISTADGGKVHVNGELWENTNVGVGDVVFASDKYMFGIYDVSGITVSNAIGQKAQKWSSVELTRSGDVFTISLDGGAGATFTPTWAVYASNQPNMVKLLSGTTGFVQDLNNVYAFEIPSPGKDYYYSCIHQSMVLPGDTPYTFTTAEPVEDGYTIGNEVSWIYDGSTARSAVYIPSQVVIEAEPNSNASLMLVTLTILFVLPVMMAIRIITGRGE